MWHKKQARVEDLQTLRDITDDVLEDEFVPYACLFNENTILTKNGELLQTIVIRNPLQGSQEGAPNLREYLRDAVAKHIPSARYALWFQTVRRKVDVTPPGEYANKFAAELNKNWVERNRFADQYATYVYVSIVREGEAIPLMRPQAFLRGLLPFAEINHRNEYLGNIFDELDAVTQNILRELKPFGAQSLGSYSKINKRGEKIFYSDQMKFLERIINLEERPMRYTSKALDKYLTSGEVTFGFNAMEMRTPKGNRRFGALLTIKEYKEASLGALDRFLMLPIDYIVTQCVDFINSEEAQKNYKRQGFFADLGKDPKLKAQTEIDKILESDQGKVTDFGQQQTTIFILADDMVQLEKDVLTATRHLCAVGVIVVREDIHFEECYWAQLPGNFEFLRRLRPTSTRRLGGFANTPPFAADTSADAKWGFPISSFHTANGMPYCLHLHDGDNPNTIILGPNIRYVTRLSHFLLAQATKFKPHIFYIDSVGRGRAIAKELGLRSWLSIEGINPFMLPDNPSNQAFLLRWLGILVRVCGKSLPEEAREVVKSTIAEIMRIPVQKRSFAFFLARVNEKSPLTGAAFSDWGANGQYGYLLQARGDFSLGEQTYFDLSNLMEVPAARVVMASWILQYVTSNIVGKRSLLLLSDVFALLADTHVLANLSSWFAYLQKNDTAVMLASGEVEQAFDNPLCPQILAEMANRFFMPDALPDQAYATIAGLSEDQFMYLEMMNAEAGHFLLCQRKQTIVGNLDPEVLSEQEETLAGDPPSSFGVSITEEQEEEALW